MRSHCQTERLHVAIGHVIINSLFNPQVSRTHPRAFANSNESADSELKNTALQGLLDHAVEFSSSYKNLDRAFRFDNVRLGFLRVKSQNWEVFF